LILLIFFSSMALTSLHFTFFHYRMIGDNKNRGMGLKNTIMRFWKRRRSKLIHDYSLVGYILSPNPTIMEHAVENKTLAHDEATERLITKLLLDPSLVGNKRTVERAKLIDSFMEEYGNFTNRCAMFLGIIYGSLPLMTPQRLINGITSILIPKQRYWASLHALCSQRHWELEPPNGTGSR
jgi:hypothetical protein